MIPSDNQFNRRIRMKRFSVVIFMCLAFIGGNAGRADTLIYNMKFYWYEYKQKNTGNERDLYRHRRGFLVTDYDSTTQTFSNSYFIYFWKEKGNQHRKQKTEPFSGNLNVCDVNSTQYALGGLTSNKEKDKDFEVLSSRKRMGFNPNIVENYKIPKYMDGVQIKEDVNAYGEKTYISTRMRGTISKQKTTEYLSSGASSAVSSIQSNLADLGYIDESEDTSGDDDDNG